ncbi:MAG: phosphoribosylglycinamide formyltransferase [Tannerella sp.]|nr:phosphoribosylglycinamide formyltransferase [Tannerella sp.]
MNRKNIAIFASGSGTNAENIIKYFAAGDTVRVAVVLSNRQSAGVHARAERLGTPSFTFGNAEFRDGTAILSVLAEYKADLIVLAGFMSLVSPAIIDAYEGRIINIHPALLPRHGGKGMYGRRVHDEVVAEKETETGISIHYVNERYDEGQIIFQAKCEVLPGDTAEDVEKKVHLLEYRHFPAVIEELLS